MTHATQAEHDLFADTLVCDDEFPWQLRIAAGSGDSAAAGRRAETMLRAMACLDEPRADDADNLEPVAPRVEAKLDLALGMLAALIAERTPLPPSAALRWSRHGFRVCSKEAFTPGNSAILGMYLAAALPFAITVPVRVLACEQCDMGHALWLDLPDATPALSAALERELFRRHRRLVHEQRHPTR